MPLRKTLYPEAMEAKDLQSGMQRQRIQDTTPGGRMKTCPTCGSEVKELWKEHWCHCGCGISYRASDPDADKSIEAWKKRHGKVCNGKKQTIQNTTKDSGHLKRKSIK
jgi:hypothetical protein